MKLSEVLSGMMYKKAKLKLDIELNNGEKREKGDVVSILINYGNGYYHAEHNEFACKVHESEIEFIWLISK